MKTSNKPIIISEIPSKWKIEKLGEYGECIRGVSYKPNDLVDNSEKGVIILRSNNINNQRINFNELKYVLAKNVSDKQVLRDNDIVICMSNGSKRLVGKAARYISMGEENTVSFGAFCSAFRVYDYQQADFIFQLFQSDAYQRQIDLALAGSAINNLKDSSIKNLLFAFPSQSEQLKISKILSTVDEKIEVIDKQIAQTQELKKGLMQRLLNKGIGHTEFKPSPLGEIPESWEVVKQSEVATFFNGRAYKLSEWENFGTPVIRLQNLTGSGKDYYYSNLKLPDHQYCNEGDLLYMWSATFGPVWWKGGKAIYHYHIWKIEVNEQRLNKAFLYYLLDTVTTRMKSQSHGSTMLHVTKGGMEQLNIALPPLTEQKKITKVLVTVDEKLEVLIDKKGHYQELKKGLMQQLLTGKLRVNHLVEEPELA